MKKKKILVIDESPLFRDFLRSKLEAYGFDVALGVNGLDGSMKIRSESPDLVVMEYHLSRATAIEVLERKNADPNIKDIPVFVASSKIDRNTLVQLGTQNVRKFFTKPIKVDALLQGIGEALGVGVQIDTTPCIIEAHVNEDILFVEIAQGLNMEKLELLKYKLHELIDLHELKTPRILLMMTSIDVTSADSIKLNVLFNSILDIADGRAGDIMVLTNADYIIEYLAEHAKFRTIRATNSIETAMDALMGRHAGSYLQGENGTVQHEFLQASAPKKKREETINLRFQEDVGHQQFDLGELPPDTKAAIVDDDFVIHELISATFADTPISLETFDNGRRFLESPQIDSFDIIFLDLMMPELDGFQVLNEVRKRGIKVPIIVLSALSKRETVVSTLRLGVKSYLIKPLRPEAIRKKATEILQMNF